MKNKVSNPLAPSSGKNKVLPIFLLWRLIVIKPKVFYLPLCHQPNPRVCVGGLLQSSAVLHLQRGSDFHLSTISHQLHVQSKYLVSMYFLIKAIWLKSLTQRVIIYSAEHFFSD